MNGASTLSTEKLRRTDPGLGFHLSDSWVWCGSVTETETGFHMFASRWSKRDPMFEGYLLHSEIVRAFSPTPEGPYTLQAKTLPNGPETRWDGKMAHNPTVLNYAGRFYLFYIGLTYDGEITAGEMANPLVSQRVYNAIRIGVASADSVTGPWKTLDHPVIEPDPSGWEGAIITNPAPCVAPDGRIFLYYRTGTPQGLRIGLAVADRPEGPYLRVGNGPVLDGFNVEDPFVWHRDGVFHLIAKDMTGEITGERHAGAGFRSKDGIHWAYERKAYSRTVIGPDGREIALGCLERPQLCFDRAGNPAYLFAAAADGPGGFRNAANTWNMALNLSEETNRALFTATGKGNNR